MRELKKWAEYSLVGILSVALAFVWRFAKDVLPGILLGIMLTASAEKTVMQTVPSPDGAYEAYVLWQDAGAIGGDSFVYVKKLKDIGIFQHENKQL